MSKEQLWAFFISHNPRLVTDPHLTPDSIRRFFDLVWDSAYEAASEDWVVRQTEMAGVPSQPMPSDEEFIAMMETLTSMANEKKKK